MRDRFEAYQRKKKANGRNLQFHHDSSFISDFTTEKMDEWEETELILMRINEICICNAVMLCSITKSPKLFQYSHYLCSPLVIE